MEKNTPVTTPAPRGTSPSCDTALKTLVEEEEPPVGEVASGTPSMLVRQKVGDLSRCHLLFIQVLANSPCSGRFLLLCKILSWRVYSGLFVPIWTRYFVAWEKGATVCWLLISPS